MNAPTCPTLAPVIYLPTRPPRVQKAARTAGVTVGQVNHFLTLCHALAAFSQSASARALIALFAEFPAPASTHLQRALAPYCAAPEVRAMVALLASMQPPQEPVECST